MNETLLFTENGKMYICKRAAYHSNGFVYPEIWEECTEIPEKIKDTQPRGAAAVTTQGDKKYMLYNTAGEASGKWFAFAGEGIRFEQPENIPDGVVTGYEFITSKFPDREFKIRRRFSDKSVKIIVEYGNLDADDFRARDNDLAKNMEHYEEMRAFFAMDLYDKIMFSSVIEESNRHHKKYSDKSTDITIDDILSDRISGNWKYMGGIGEIVF